MSSDPSLSVQHPALLTIRLILCLMLHARASASVPSADPKPPPSASATVTAAPAPVVEGNFPRLGGEEMAGRSMRARLGPVQGPKMPFGRLSATLGLGARKEVKVKGNRGHGCGRNNKINKKNNQKRKNNKHKVVFFVCLQIFYDILLFM